MAFLLPTHNKRLGCLFSFILCFCLSSLARAEGENLPFANLLAQAELFDQDLNEYAGQKYLDAPSAFTKEIEELWRRYEDEAFTSRKLNLAWLWLHFCRDGGSDPAFSQGVRQFIKEFQIKFPNHQRYFELEFLLLVSSSLNFTSYAAKAFEIVSKIENDAYRFRGAAYLVFESLGQGISVDHTANLIGQLRSRSLTEVSQLRAAEVSGYNSLASVYKKLNLTQEAEQIENLLRRYCKLSQKRFFCSVFYYNLGIRGVKKSGYSPENLAHMEASYDLALNLGQAFQIATVAYGLNVILNTGSSYEKARIYAEIAVKNIELANQYPAWKASIYREYSESLVKLGFLREAKTAIDVAIATCPEYESKDLIEIYKQAAVIYAELKDFKKAFAWQSLQIEKQNTLALGEKKELSSNLRFQSDLILAQQEKKLLTAQNDLENIRNRSTLLLRAAYFMLFCFLALALTSILVLLAKKKQAKQKLVAFQGQKKESEAQDARFQLASRAAEGLQQPLQTAVARLSENRELLKGLIEKVKTLLLHEGHSMSPSIKTVLEAEIQQFHSMAKNQGEMLKTLGQSQTLVEEMRILSGLNQQKFKATSLGQWTEQLIADLKQDDYFADSIHILQGYDLDRSHRITIYLEEKLVIRSLLYVWREIAHSFRDQSQFKLFLHYDEPGARLTLDFSWSYQAAVKDRQINELTSLQKILQSFDIDSKVEWKSQGMTLTLQFPASQVSLVS